MNTNERTEHMKAFVAAEEETVVTKGREYTLGATRENDLDTLNNFKQVGEMVKTTCPNCQHTYPIGARVTWAVYFLKHVFSVLTHMGNPGKAKDMAETLFGRFLDIRVYSTLGFCIDVDESRTTVESLMVDAEASGVPVHFTGDHAPGDQGRM